MKKLSLVVLAVTLGLSACVSTSTYKKEQARAGSLEQQIAKLQNDINQLDQQKAALDQNLKATQTERDALNAALQARKDELAKRVSDLSTQNEALARQLRETEQAKEAEIARLKSTQDQLMSSLQAEIANGEIAVTQLKGKLTVQLVDKILFDSGRADIKQSGQQVLSRIGDILNKVQDKDIRIEGHTDNVPIGGALAQRYPSNWELSTARATVVVRFLQEKTGIDPKRLIAAGYGEQRPVSPNDSEVNRAQNRRIEIALVAPEAASAPMPARAAAPSK